jgi:excisionase family DNA binding protein
MERPELTVRLEFTDKLVEDLAARVALALMQDGRLRADAGRSPFMTVPEAADYLRCRRARVDNLLSERRLTRVKEGGRTLLLLEEVEALPGVLGRRVTGPRNVAA